jgi:hypothetical protein
VEFDVLVWFVDQYCLFEFGAATIVGAAECKVGEAK